MITAKIAGALILALPLLLIAWIALRRQRAVRMFAAALILVGTGYLMATGATDDIGRSVLGLVRDMSLQGHGTTAPAPATPPAN